MLPSPIAAGSFRGLGFRGVGVWGLGFGVEGGFWGLGFGAEAVGCAKDILGNYGNI